MKLPNGAEIENLMPLDEALRLACKALAMAGERMMLYDTRLGDNEVYAIVAIQALLDRMELGETP